MEMMTGSRAGLLYVQRLINRKVMLNISQINTNTYSEGCWKNLKLFCSFPQKKNRLLCRKLWISSSGSSKGAAAFITYWSGIIVHLHFYLTFSNIYKKWGEQLTALGNDISATKNCLCLLCRKDPNAFFSFPVTDLIAPGYSAVIKRPMDFSTMKDKVKKECYQSLDELKVHVCVLLHSVRRNK